MTIISVVCWLLPSSSHPWTGMTFLSTDTAWWHTWHFSGGTGRGAGGGGHKQDQRVSWLWEALSQQYYYYSHLTCKEGNPLQYSCLENPTDRAWRATIHRVAKSQTHWSDLVCMHIQHAKKQKHIYLNICIEPDTFQGPRGEVSWFI